MIQNIFYLCYLVVAEYVAANMIGYGVGIPPWYVCVMVMILHIPICKDVLTQGR